MDTTHVYCFVGSVCEVGIRKLEKFGAKISLTDLQALHAIDGGAQLCPQEDFHFTDEEVKKYSTAKFRLEAPEEFKARYKAALQAIHTRREELKKADLLERIKQAKPGEMNWALAFQSVQPSTPQDRLAVIGIRHGDMLLKAEDHPEVDVYCKEFLRTQGLLNADPDEGLAAGDVPMEGF